MGRVGRMAGVDSGEFAKWGSELGRWLDELLARAADTRRSAEDLHADGAGGGPRPSEGSGSIAAALLTALDGTDRLVRHLRRHVMDGAADGGTESVVDAPVVPGARGLLHTLRVILAQALKQPDVLAKHYAAFAGEAMRILGGGSTLAPQPGDFRFKDKLWFDSVLMRTALQLYLAWSRTLQAWLDEQALDDKDKRRIDFVLKQLIAALAPSNLPLNPAALRRADTTQGESAVNGLRQWIDDVLHHHAMPRQIRPDAYVVGRDLAATPGAVVFRNEQLELIQYAPQAPAVRRRPVLVLPPQINKFYAFDLRPQNSAIAHLLRSGLQLFILSWRNPTAAEAGWNLDTYVRAVLEATDAIRAITRSRTMGLISACAGGLTSMALLGWLAESGQRRITNHTLLVTCLFPNQGSDMELFATPTAIALMRSYVSERRIMSGEELAQLFFWLRPTDLVWRYWINNYLLGKQPPRLDVLFWDNDSTRLPAAVHDDFVTMYERDVFQRPNSFNVLGRPIDFRKIAVDSYYVGGEDDYLMPWVGCYRACHVFRGRKQFVLSTSGHIQSILRPPGIADTFYFTNPDTRLDADAWRRGATRHDGSWWTHWYAWLHTQSGAWKAAPSRLGSAAFPPLDPAPGRYVFD